MNSNRKPVAVVIGATSKWQSDGRNTHLIHGGDLDDSDLPVGVRWGVGRSHIPEIRTRGLPDRADHPQRLQRGRA